MIENGRINVAYILLALHKFYRFVISNKLDTKKNDSLQLKIRKRRRKRKKNEQEDEEHKRIRIFQKICKDEKEWQREPDD